MLVSADVVAYPSKSPDKPWVVFSASKGRALLVPPAQAQWLLENSDQPIDFVIFSVDDRNLLHAYGLVSDDLHLPLVLPAVEKIKSIRSGSKLAFLELIISEGCNFACPHCIHSVNLTTTDNRQINTYMSLDVAISAIDEFINALQYNDHPTIHFGSAEPLIQWGLFKSCVEYVRQHYSKLNINLSATTNFSLLNEERIKFIVANAVSLSTSLDGQKEANDAVRMTKKGYGTFERIIEKMALYQAHGGILDSVTLTISDRNIDLLEIDKFLDIVSSFGLIGIGVDFDLVTSEIVDPDRIANKLIEIYEKCSERNLACSGTWTKPLENLFRDDLESQHDTHSFCKAVDGRNVAVSPNGKLFMCGYTSTTLGTLGEMNSGYMEKLAQLVENREAAVASHCSACDLRSACRGQCHTTHEVSAFGNNKKIDLMCDVYRLTTRELASRLASC